MTHPHALHDCRQLALTLLVIEYDALAAERDRLERRIEDVTERMAEVMAARESLELCQEAATSLGEFGKLVGIPLDKCIVIRYTVSNQQSTRRFEMTNLNELHQAVVTAANTLREAQAVTDAERTANDGIASKPTRNEEKAARKVYDNAMWQFQNAIDELETLPANIAEMYAEIGKIRL